MRSAIWRGRCCSSGKAAGEKARLEADAAQQRDQTEVERRQSAAAQAKAAEEQAAAIPRAGPGP